ncbi:MAG: TlpA family protein disulfide reductase [Gemmatimonadota bacterium]
MAGKRAGLSAVAVLLLAVSVAAIVRGRPRAVDGASAGDRGGAPWLEIPAPVIPFETVERDTSSLLDYRGGIVLLNFWGTWCAPCLVEIPHLIAVQRELEELGGTIIGPAVDSGSPEDVRRFAAKRGMTWPLWMADYEQSVGVYGAEGYPFTLLIDAGGVIRQSYLGPQTKETLLQDIRRLAAERPALRDTGD